MSTPVVRLHPKRDARVRHGHPWVFSNEIAEPPVAELPEGGLVDVVSSTGAFLGKGYANPRSLITVRLLTQHRKADPDTVAFWRHRLQQALDLRRAVYPERESYRLVHGEADGLPGVVIDRFHDVVDGADVLSVQITTLGMEVRKPLLAEALNEVLAPMGAVLRNDVRVRELEGLSEGREVWFGEVPEAVVIDEYGVKFRIEPLGGQKTGHFFDQADNRLFAAGLCEGNTVLDVYCNTGGFGLHALAAGASHVTFVDKSEAVCEQIVANLEINDWIDRATIVCDEGRRTLIGLQAEAMRFGVVVLDPPAFAKTKKAAGNALRGYQEINKLGVQLVPPEGFLFTSSCSHHVLEERFLEAVHAGAQEAHRTLKGIRRGEQAADHPVLPAVPETRYLKSFGFQVL